MNENGTKCRSNTEGDKSMEVLKETEKRRKNDDMTEE